MFTINCIIKGGRIFVSKNGVRIGTLLNNYLIISTQVSQKVPFNENSCNYLYTINNDDFRYKN